MNRIRMAVVGVGHLGKEHARILAALPDVELVGVADVNHDQAAGRRRPLPHRGVSTAIDDLLDLVDAVSHRRPDPLSPRRSPGRSSTAAFRSWSRSRSPRRWPRPTSWSSSPTARGVPFQVGHIERFNPAFEDLTRRPLTPKLIEAERHGPFTGRSTDIGVVLDLMIHDLDLILSLVRSPVTRRVRPGRAGVRRARGHRQRPADVRERLRGQRDGQPDQPAAEAEAARVGPGRVRRASTSSRSG